MRNGFNSWLVQHLKTINFYITEFGINYCSKKKERNGGEINQSSMKSYLFSLVRFSPQDDWSHKIDIKHEIFTSKENDLVTVMYNTIGEKQSKGMVSESHNVLSVKDVRKLDQSQYM